MAWRCWHSPAGSYHSLCSKPQTKHTIQHYYVTDGVATVLGQQNSTTFQEFYYVVWHHIKTIFTSLLRWFRKTEILRLLKNYSIETQNFQWPVCFSKTFQSRKNQKRLQGLSITLKHLLAAMYKDFVYQPAHYSNTVHLYPLWLYMNVHYYQPCFVHLQSPCNTSATRRRLHRVSWLHCIEAHLIFQGFELAKGRCNETGMQPSRPHSWEPLTDSAF